MIFRARTKQNLCIQASRVNFSSQRIEIVRPLPSSMREEIISYEMNGEKKTDKREVKLGVNEEKNLREKERDWQLARSSLSFVFFV